MIAWLGVNTWFLAVEGIPHGRGGITAGYETVIADGLMHRDSWMRIVSGERVIGYSHSRIDIDEYTPGGQYLLLNETVADLPLFGSQQRTAIRSRIILDADRRLTEFHFDIQSIGNVIRVHGQHVGNHVFSIGFEGPINLPAMRINLPRDTLILPPTAEIGLRELRPGRTLTLQVFDPLTLRSTPLTVATVRRDSITHAGRSRPVTVMSMAYQGMTLHSWVDDDGNVLRQETPLGWTLEACEPEDAMVFMQPRTRADGPANNGPEPATP